MANAFFCLLLYPSHYHFTMLSLLPQAWRGIFKGLLLVTVKQFFNDYVYCIVLQFIFAKHVPFFLFIKKGAAKGFVLLMMGCICFVETHWKSNIKPWHFLQQNFFLQVCCSILFDKCSLFKLQSCESINRIIRYTYLAGNSCNQPSKNCTKLCEKRPTCP